MFQSIGTLLRSNHTLDLAVVALVVVPSIGVWEIAADREIECRQIVDRRQHHCYWVYCCKSTGAVAAGIVVVVDGANANGMVASRMVAIEGLDQLDYSAVDLNFGSLCQNRWPMVVAVV